MMDFSYHYLGETEVVLSNYCTQRLGRSHQKYDFVFSLDPTIFVCTV